MKGLDLSDFAPAPEVAPGRADRSPESRDLQDARGESSRTRIALDRRAIDGAAEFRRRDPADELTITVRGPSATIRAFKALCRAERRSQAEMLRRMLDAYGDPKP